MDHAAPPRPRRQLSIIAILVVAIATPATLALSYYRLTGDPTFRPLALTVERLIAVGETVDSIGVQAIVTTDGTPAGLRRSQIFGDRLAAAFYGKGLKMHLRIEPLAQPGPPRALFLIGPSRLGPFTESTAAHGVQLAAEAAAIHRSEEEIARKHRW